MKGNERLLVLKVVEQLILNINTDTVSQAIVNLQGILKTVGTDEDLESKCRSLVQAGQKIWAVKMYKEATGIGLKEAKQIIDNL